MYSAKLGNPIARRRVSTCAESAIGLNVHHLIRLLVVANIYFLFVAGVSSGVS